MTPSERIKDLIGRLVLRDSLWGFMFSKIGKKESEEFPYIAGVGAMKDGMLYLLYNPTMISQMSDKDIEIVLEHEGIHVLNKHIPRLLRILFNETSKEEKKRKEIIWNYATDFNSNYMIGAPDYLMVDNTQYQLLKAGDYGLKNGETSEYYFNKLLEREQDNQKQNQSSSNSQSQSSQNNGSQQNQSSSDSQSFLDDKKEFGHGQWMNDLKEIPDLQSFSRRIDQITKEIVSQSVNSVRNKGNLPGNVKELIEECLKPPKVPYYMIIKKLVKGSRLAKYKMAYTKINRKRTYLFLTGEEKGLPVISPFPGKQKDTTFDISLISDTSGSMSKKDIEESLKGLKHIIENDRYCKTTVIQIDTKIRKEYVAKKIKDIDFEISGRGGTELLPALFRAKELETDITLCFTDGGCENINCADRKLLPKKIIWILPPDGVTHMIDKVGYIVRITK